MYPFTLTSLEIELELYAIYPQYKTLKTAKDAQTSISNITQYADYNMTWEDREVKYER